MVSRGIIYVATGKRYIDEAIASAQTVKAIMPDIPITLFTDTAIEHETLFDTVLILPQAERGFADKIVGMKQSPYHHTVFLDTDTHICAPCYELFDLLDHFDIAMAQVPAINPYRITVDMNILLDKPIPNSFPEFNTGVIAYRKTDAVLSLFDEWLALFQQTKGQLPHLTDQPALRAVLYASDLRFSVLPPEYNMRYFDPVNGGDVLVGTVKIVHARDYDNHRVQHIAATINKLTIRRFLVSNKLFVSDKMDRLKWVASMDSRRQNRVLRVIWSYYTLFMDKGIVGSVQHLYTIMRNKFAPPTESMPPDQERDEL